MATGSKTEHDKFLENGRFKVEIQGCQTSADDCVTVQIDPMRVRILDVTHGNDWDYRRIKAGHTEYGVARFKFRVHDESLNKDLKEWQEKCRTGVKNDTRKTITVSLKDRPGETARQYILNECFCTYFHHGEYTTDSSANLSEMHVHIGYVSFQ